MYIEKNGYVVMKEEEMSFYDKNGEFSDDLEDAYVFTQKSDAEITAKEFTEELNSNFEVVNYHKTIWIDKDGLINEVTNTCHCNDNECPMEFVFNDCNYREETNNE